MPILVKFLFLVGGIAFLLGLLLWIWPNAFSWFGRLPGDIRHQSPTSRVYIPITSMIVVSIVLTIIVNVARWIWGGR